MQDRRVKLGVRGGGVFAQGLPFVALRVDPDDDWVAARNERLGYPRRLVDARGNERDYIVMPIDKPHPQPHALADETAERRARKRAGIADGGSFARAMWCRLRLDGAGGPDSVGPVAWLVVPST